LSTDGRSVRDITAEILTAAGWLGDANSGREAR
jgi:hypothetical protein